MQFVCAIKCKFTAQNERKLKVHIKYKYSEASKVTCFYEKRLKDTDFYNLQSVIRRCEIAEYLIKH